MDAFTARHLRTWAAGFFPTEEEAAAAVEALEAFAGEHPDLLEPPRSASWPEVWSLVDRDA